MVSRSLVEIPLASPRAVSFPEKTIPDGKDQIKRRRSRQEIFKSTESGIVAGESHAPAARLCTTADTARQHRAKPRYPQGNRGCRHLVPGALSPLSRIARHAALHASQSANTSAFEIGSECVRQTGFSINLAKASENKHLCIKITLKGDSRLGLGQKCRSSDTTLSCSDRVRRSMGREIRRDGDSQKIPDTVISPASGCRELLRECLRQGGAGLY